jgi:hypothetical protein
MFDSLAPGEIVAKPIDMAAATRRGDAVRNRRTPTRFSLLAAVLLPALFVGNVAMAQVDGQFDGTVTPTPTIGATSPLGVAGSPTGIPLGAIEITSPGVSPLPTGVTGTITVPATSSGTACSTVATSPSEMYGSTASYDGGGMAVGNAAPATAANSGTTANSGTSTSSATSVTSAMPITSGSSGMIDTSGTSGMCGSGSSSTAASSSPTSTSPTTPGGGARTGIPFGSFEIGNLGVSSTPAVPVPNVLPIVGTVGPSSLMPTMPTISPTTPATNPACATTGTTGTITTGGIGSFAGAGNAGVPGTSISARLLRQSILCQR